eukprot:1872874-Prymnesium_polylepis.3
MAVEAGAAKQVAEREGRSRPAPLKVDRDFTWPCAQCVGDQKAYKHAKSSRGQSLDITIYKSLERTVQECVN